jgi:hypothetical protein
MDQARYLIVSRVGPDSLHRHWLEPGGRRNFDLFLSSYDPDLSQPQGEGVHFEYRPGRKVAGYGAFLAEHAELLRRYDYVALFDDDLLVGSEELSRLFDIVAGHGLKIAQPALTPDSYFTYAALLRHPGFLLRQVTYVEMMCPVFRTDILLSLAPLFHMGYESGIDIIWSNMVDAGPEDLAVIDAVAVQHSRRVGSAKAANGFAAGRVYEDDISAILARFQCPWLPCVLYGGVRTDGRRVVGRTAMLAAAASLITALPAQAPIKRRARNMAVYWKHLLTAPARNIRLDMDAIRAG